MSLAAFDARLRNNFQEIVNAAERAAGLTSHLLAFSRRQIIETHVIDLNSLIRDVEQMLQRVIKDDIDMEVAGAPNLKPVRVDPGQIERLILNMAANAAEAMPDGGNLTIDTRNVQFNVASELPDTTMPVGEYVELAVVDDGTGMTEEVVLQIFEPLFSTKIETKGTGLGLSTCCGIVRQHGGHITVTSEPGQGSTFKIYLPVADEEAPKGVDRIGSDRTPNGTETILLVENDAAVRELAARTLQDQGYDVLTASNALDALRVSRVFGPGEIQLLLTDMGTQLPGGQELSEDLRKLHPDIKVLFTSGNTLGAIADRGLLEGGFSHTQKHFLPSLLTLRVREVLDGRAATPIDAISAD